MAAADYGRGGRRYVTPTAYGFAVVPVLDFLRGEPWDDLAADALMTLRPSHVRVIGHDQSETTDACGWRVTVYLDDQRRISKVQQEVEVGTDYRGGGSGHDFRLDLLKRGIDLMG